MDSDKQQLRENDKKIEHLYTHTLFYLAQTYGIQGRTDLVHTDSYTQSLFLVSQFIIYSQLTIFIHFLFDFVFT